MENVLSKGELKEKAETVKEIAWQYVHPYQSVEEFNEWKEVHSLAEGILNYLEKEGK